MKTQYHEFLPDQSDTVTLIHPKIIDLSLFTESSPSFVVKYKTTEIMLMNTWVVSVRGYMVCFTEL